MSTRITIQTNSNIEMEIALRFYAGAGKGGTVRVCAKDRETALAHWGGKRCREDGRATGKTFAAWLRAQERKGYRAEFGPAPRRYDHLDLTGAR